MKQLTLLFAILALSLSGCSTFTGDKVVVTSEISERTGNDTLDAFVNLDRANQAWMVANAPTVHAYANVIRRNGVRWLQSARAATRAYKMNRTPEGKVNMDTALAVLNAAISQSTQYIAQINAQITATPAKQ